MLRELLKVSKPKLPPGSLEEQYYILLSQGKSDHEIESTLPCSNNNHFRQVKFRLRHQMLDSLITYRRSQSGTSLEEVSNAYKWFSAGSILMIRQAHQAGVQALKKALTMASNQQKIALALECAKQLAAYYSSLNGEGKKFLYYQGVVDEHQERLYHETICTSLYNKISYKSVTNWHADVFQEASDACKKMEPYKTASFVSANAYYFTLFLGKISSLDFKGLIAACDEALQYFDAYPNPPRGSLYSILLRKATGLIHLQRYEEAKTCTKRVMDIAEKGKYSYCAALFYRGVIGLHSGEIKISEEALTQADLYIDYLPATLQEQFRILEAYVALFSSRKFKIGKFLNQVPVFEKDKAGANAAILIVQMLHYIKDAKTSAYIDRCDALSRYTSRYLYGKKKILAKLLLEVEKGHFSHFTVEYRTRKLVKQLSIQDRELEIMPAEQIWALVTEWLR